MIKIFAAAVSPSLIKRRAPSASAAKGRVSRVKAPLNCRAKYGITYSYADLLFLFLNLKRQIRNGIYVIIGSNAPITIYSD